MVRCGDKRCNKRHNSACYDKTTKKSSPQETWAVAPALAKCWPNVVDVGPAFSQRWADICPIHRSFTAVVLSWETGLVDCGDVNQ